MSTIPSDERVSIEVNLKGEATSKNLGVNRGVLIHNHGVTQITATKRIHFDSKGVRSDPAEAECTTDSTIDSIQAKSQMVQRIAWKRAQRSQGRANSIASRHAETRVEESVDTQSKEMLGEASEFYQEQFRKPLIRRDGFPDELVARSSEMKLVVQVKQRGRFQVAAPSTPPKLVEGNDLAVRMHESLVRIGFQLRL